MFTGIIECVGHIDRVLESGTNVDLIVRSSISDSLKIDQSVAHNGVCLTVVAVGEGKHTVTVIKESLERSAIGFLEEGSTINLERCLKLGDRLDGHMVQGHVDTTVRCKQAIDEDGSWRFQFELPENRAMLVPKGSICINGVSLTIASLTDEYFEVAIIPYTFEHTTFAVLSAGHYVNIEYDILGKYVARQLQIQNT